MSNPQTVYYNFKESIQRIARTRLRAKIPRIRRTIDSLANKISALGRHHDAKLSVAIQDEISLAQDRLQSLLKAQNNDLREVSMARYVSNGERVSKFWSSVNRNLKPRDLFLSLHIPGSWPPRYETRSDKMAQLAGSFHDDLQHDGIQDCSPSARIAQIDSSLSACDKTFSAWEANSMRGHTTREELEQAIREAPAGKATGLDGLPYELWKRLCEVHRLRKGSTKPHFDYALMLELVCKDINNFGVHPNGHFTDGWMCPLYKKGDRRDIRNYCPITLLNSDYKVYSKSLATRLALVINGVIHSSQAAFIPGRHIESQTQLCRVMMDYCEAVEEDGLLVALDQEKAYDRVRHDYLWRTLARFKVPDSMIVRIRRLYEHARTTVFVNGERSAPFLVKRGVRQGDPLSCLLFIFAIEPLSCQLRSSPLSGFHIPGAAERLINNLFADDTSAFLSKSDRWSDLWHVLDTWCESSGVRFNNLKTEVIPLGSKTYRDSVRLHRTVSGLPGTDVIASRIHIADDGEPVRILGAWVGYNVSQLGVWSPIIQKIANFLTRWGRCHPSLLGKRHIVQMGPGGISQYLTKVQGMPREVEDQIVKLI